MVAQTTSEIMTPDQVAAYLQFETEKIYELIETGQLIASRIGDDYRIQKQHIDLLLWNTQTRPGIVLREYTDEQIEQFLNEDELNEEQLAIVERFTRMMDARDAQR